MKTFSWRFYKKGRHFNRKVKKSNVKIHVILLIWNINEQFTQFCKSYPGLRIRIREDPEFFQLLDPDPGKKSWFRIQESLCQKLFIFEQNLTNSKVKTGLHIRIREFFSSWIRIREKYFRRIRIRENISRIRNSDRPFYACIYRLARIHTSHLRPREGAHTSLISELQFIILDRVVPEV